MNRDLMMYLDVYGDYGHLPRPEAVKAVAEKHELSRAGVSGMATRGAARPGAQVELMTYIASKTSPNNESYETIQQIVSEGQSRHARHAARLADEGGIQYAVFRSDIHLPVFDAEALALYLHMLKVINPVYISALNDALDNATISRWDDRRRLSDMAFDDDVTNLLRLHKVLSSAEVQAAPHAQLIAVTGNHDLRLGNIDKQNLRAYTEAQMMKELSAHGVVFTAPLSRQNVIEINSGLYWTHGFSHAKSGLTRGKANQEQVKYELKLSHDFNLVTGHVHRGDATPTPYGVHYTAPCLCDLNPSYMRHKPRWTQGFVVSAFNPQTTWSHTQVIEFTRINGVLTAFWNGQAHVTS